MSRRRWGALCYLATGALLATLALTADVQAELDLGQTVGAQVNVDHLLKGFAGPAQGKARRERVTIERVVQAHSYFHLGR